MEMLFNDADVAVRQLRFIHTRILALLVCEMRFSINWNSQVCRITSFWAIALVGTKNTRVCKAFVPPACRHSSLLQQQQQQLSMTTAITTTDSDTVQDIRHVDGIRHIANDFDIFLLDMWGVMHDGSKPYDGVLDSIQRLKDLKKTMMILSNSSKRQDNSVRMLKKLGFNPDDFDQIITSGELSYRMLSHDETLECEPWSVLEDMKQQSNKKVFCLGSGSQDVEYCESCGWTMAPVEDADLVVARGTFTIVDSEQMIHKEQGEDEYFRVLDESLKVAAKRQLPLFVTNPDKVRPDEGLPPMPGAIGDAYEAILGDKQGRELVKRVGKPFRDVYDLALAGKEVDMSRVCMIGDALETDVMGASKIGCTSVWVVNDGIHSADIAEKANGKLEVGTAAILEEFNEKEGTYAKDRRLMPDICVPHFRW